MSYELEGDLDSLVNQKHEVVFEMYQKEPPDFKKIEDSILEIWNLLPEPKENWTEGFRTAAAFFLLYLEDLKDFKKADNWLNKLKEIEENINYSLGQVLFDEGRLYFERGEYEKAYKSFKATVKEGKGFRYFEDEDPKYLDFYTHPEKYSNQIKK